jgi:hypothetical protein
MGFGGGKGGAKGGGGDGGTGGGYDPLFAALLAGQGVDRIKAAYKNLGLDPSTAEAKDIGFMQQGGGLTSDILANQNAPNQLAANAFAAQQQNQIGGQNAFNQGVTSVQGTTPTGTG